MPFVSAHIFFDDAFQLSDSTDFYSPMEINPFVRIFVGRCIQLHNIHSKKSVTVKKTKLYDF